MRHSLHGRRPSVYHYLSSKGFRVLRLIYFRPTFFFFPFLKFGASLGSLGHKWRHNCQLGSKFDCRAQVLSYIGMHKAFVFRLSCKPPLLKLCLKTPPSESARTTPKGWPPHNFFLRALPCPFPSFCGKLTWPDRKHPKRLDVLIA